MSTGCSVFTEHDKSEVPENRAVFRKRDMNPPKNKVWDSRAESRPCFAGDSFMASGARDEQAVGRRPHDRLHGQYGLPFEPSVSSCAG